MIKKWFTKRNKYLIFTGLSTYFLYYFYTKNFEHYSSTLILFFIFLIIGNLLVNNPDVNLRGILVTNILPFLFTVGVILSLQYYPNLSTNFRIVSFISYFVLLYSIFLVNNIFLVVDFRKEIIPIYRVALTWCKIFIVISSIPLMAGIFKLSLIPYVESSFVALIIFLFLFYLTWALKFNNDIKKYRVGEIITLFLFGIYLIVISSLCVSFIPTEAFLRAIFLASVLIFVLTYLENHLKNTLNLRIIIENLLITFIFFIILLVFNT